MMGAIRKHPHFHEMLHTVINTVVESIQSPEMARRAADSAKSLHPDVSPCMVMLQVDRPEETEVINLVATGTDSKYIRFYLDALVDEFITARAAWRESAARKVYSPFLQAVVDQQRKMEEALDAEETVRKEAQSISLGREPKRMRAQLDRLLDQRVKLGLSSSDKLPALELEIRRLEAELEKFEEVASRLRKAGELYRQHSQGYIELFKQAEKWFWSEDQVIDYVHIQERTSVAVLQPVLSWRSLGWLYPGLGGLSGMVGGFWLAWRERKSGSSLVCEPPFEPCR
jgi:hypothetical protein